MKRNNGSNTVVLSVEKFVNSINEQEPRDDCEQNHLQSSLKHLCTVNNVYILESVMDFHPDYWITSAIFHQLKPKIVATSASAPKDFIRLLKNMMSSSEEGLSSGRLQLLHSKCFNYIKSKEKVFSMDVPGRFKNMGKEERRLYILSAISILDERTVCAFGALLHLLEAEYGHLPSRALISINEIRPLKLSNILLIDEETYRNLQIFDPLQHPSSFNWKRNDQYEGLSLYSLLKRYCTHLGLVRLRFFMARPTNDIKVLLQRQEVIKFYLETPNDDHIKSLKTYINNISPPSTLMKYLFSTHLRGGHWKTIFKTMYYSILAAELCKAHANKVAIFSKIADCLNEEMYAVVHQIQGVIDFDSMDSNGLFVINIGVSEELDAAKSTFYHLKSIINKVTPYEFDSVPEYVNRLNIIYVPEVKFMLAVPFWKEEVSQEELLFPGLEFKFSSCKTAFYKSKLCKELDQLLGDPQVDIMNEESKIIQGLLQYIDKHVHMFLNLIRQLSELSCILAMAQLSKDNNYSQPKFNENNIITAVASRHPLLELGNNFIPNDVNSSRELAKIKILLGPNGCGKTVFLKQVALIAYLSHMGCFVPAAEMEIGLLKYIHMRTHQYEPIAGEVSSFYIDIKRIAQAILYAGPDALIVIDEFGRGTTDITAASILISVIKYFSTQMPESPHVLISTHFQTIPDMVAGFPSVSINGIKHIAQDDHLVFLHKISQDYSKVSYALAHAISCGIPRKFVVTAQKVLDAMRRGEGVIPCSAARLQLGNRLMKFARKLANCKIKKPEALPRLKEAILHLKQNLYSNVQEI